MQSFVQKQNNSKKIVSSKISSPNNVITVRNNSVEYYHQLQRTVGNKAVQRVVKAHTAELKAGLTGTVPSRYENNFHKGIVQTKLSIGTPGDKHEQEADRIAEHVMSMPDSQLQNTRPHIQPLANESVQMKSDNPTLCGGVWTCAATPSEEPDPGRQGDGGTAKAWTLKIMIDIEVPDAKEVGASTVGHTYVEFADSTGRTYSFGFYPDKSSGTPDPLFRPQVRGCIVHPDTAHESCVDYAETFTLTKDEFESALSFAKEAFKMPPVYNIQTYNCTTFAVEVAQRAGKKLPPVRGLVGSGMLSTIADNPNKLYKGLKQRDIGPTYELEGDTEIRKGIKGADETAISKIPIEEKIRIVNRLFDGWVSDDDITTIASVYRNTSGDQQRKLKKVIEARIKDLWSNGQRATLRSIL